MVKIKSKHRSCHGCIYLGFGRTCNWFRVHRNSFSKPIPENVVDKGCDLREPSVEYIDTDDKFLINLIDRIEGELI